MEGCYLINNSAIGFVRWMAGFAAVVLAANSMAGEAPREFTIATFNINFTNTNLTEVVKTIRAAKADVVCLQETTAHSESVFRSSLSNDYPFVAFQREPGPGGFGFLSKVPLTDLRYIKREHGLFGAWIARAGLAGTNVQIAVVHLYPPNPAHMDSLSGVVEMFKEADTIQAREISRIYSQLSTNLPVIVAGDFNSFSFLGAPRFLREHGFLDSFAAVTENADSHGTWCCSYQGRTWCFRIDYIFHTSELETRESRIIKNDASDHNLLVSKLRVGPSNMSIHKTAITR